MKKLKISYFVLSAALLSLPALSVADTNGTTASPIMQTNNTSGPTPTDENIVSMIKDKMAADKTISDLKISITSLNGVVSLTGNVNTDAESSQLVETAESVQGVKDVDTSKLTVKESQQPVTDTILTAKVKGAYAREKLFGDKPIALTGISVETTDGIVYLTGTVETQTEADNAVAIAKTVTGVKSVESKLTVKPVQ